ncbi:MAG: ABC transporter ATP-binding protein [Lachnospiraceae bacterium]|nr:ABC transporter ATP-binding protein [Lachnospiraceae bacterium]MCH4062917.1 ABC transporter ATP-binding protein [Lachnospiraceae bacterium]MCH4104223.1 ABC transporter ATP-binding protein [Lachnospiraceae bacterium]MCI1309116.1 ABC transporter ATP-binding protein [Lachnospiraceae bacterium]MCI1356971.1 ABC transporter ATP-binding protein [Lachnospiraceae bacterium]
MLELSDICKSYYAGKLEIPVLHHINFQLEEGDYTAVMGPSGSGKSTLMNIIGCLDTATSGTMILDGKNVSKCTENELADLRLQKLGFIFQNYQLLPRETALDNVALPLIYAGIPLKKRRALAQEALERVGLGDKLHSFPTQLSGGQKQRVAIARAMINRPKLLLADEPTGALDSESGRQVLDLFDQIHGEGATVLMITHDPNVASRADHMVEIRDGVLYKAGEKA